MGEKTDEIERHIREQRFELGQNIHDLQKKVKDTVNWRAQFEQRPMAMMGIALGGGLLLSGLLGSRTRSSSVNPATHRPTSDSETPAQASTHATQKASHDKVPQSWRDIKTALIGVAAGRLGNALESVLPGFNDEFKRVRRSDGSDSSNRP